MSNEREKPMRKILLFVVCGLLFMVLAGCAALVEDAKGVAGRSTKILEEGRKDAITRTFNCDYNTCFEKAEKALKNMGTYIYSESKKKQLIAVFISETDTTPVGVFVKSIDANTTQLEVSSPSTYGKEIISEKLFIAVQKMLEKHEKEEETNVKKDK